MQSNLTLRQLGWSEFFQQQLTQALSGHSPARVTAAYSETWEVVSETGTNTAVPTGQLRFSGARWPAVGDWVLIQQRPGSSLATVVHVLERRSVVCRQAAGTRTEKQVIAANVDIGLVVTSFGADFSPGRVERYLAALRSDGVTPVLVLSKLDLSEAPQGTLSEASALSGATPLVVTSVQTGAGLDELAAFDREGQTWVLLGSSGVGKSSLINALLGKHAQSVHAVRESDGTGQHTTTVRQMFALPGGAMVIDTPGLRELALWASAPDVLVDAFPDIRALAQACRFRNCGHAGERGCAVQEAISTGTLDERRLRSHDKLTRELTYQAARQDRSAQLNRKRHFRAISRDNRQRKKVTGR